MVTASQKKLPDNAIARANMVVNQLRPNKVHDERVLTVMESLPRELFVPTMMNGVAYIDEDLQVGQGRYLPEPMVLARLIQAARIKSDDCVLDIAPATGYSTAVLAALAQDIVAVESDPVLQEVAVRNLAAFGIQNARVFNASMTEGWVGKAPYDVILINGSVDAVPGKLFEQLKEGGRLVTVVRHAGTAGFAHTGEARLFEKIHGSMCSRSLFDANVQPVPGFESEPSFVF